MTKRNFKELKDGESYRARNGEVYRIIGSTGNSKFPFRGEYGFAFTEKGRFLDFGKSPRDLITLLPLEEETVTGNGIFGGDFLHKAASIFPLDGKAVADDFIDDASITPEAFGAVADVVAGDTPEKPQFEHGVFYPIEELADDVEVLMFNGHLAFKAKYKMIDGVIHGFHWTRQDWVKAHDLSPTHFALYPITKEPKEVNVWDKYIDVNAMFSGVNGMFSGDVCGFPSEIVTEESLAETKACLAWQKHILKTRKDAS